VPLAIQRTVGFDPESLDLKGMRLVFRPPHWFFVRALVHFLHRLDEAEFTLVMNDVKTRPVIALFYFALCSDVRLRAEAERTLDALVSEETGAREDDPCSVYLPVSKLDVLH
jgi:hypothetical protein